MSNEACPLPQPPADAEKNMVERMLKGRRIAVVGASASPMRPVYGVMEYLVRAGFEVFPVNPKHAGEDVLGRKCYATLAEVPGVIDVVDVFRRAEACADVVREAIACNAKGVWLQSGIISPEAKELARQAGLDFVQNRCLMVDHLRAGY